RLAGDPRRYRPSLRARPGRGRADESRGGGGPDRGGRGYSGPLQARARLSGTDHRGGHGPTRRSVPRGEQSLCRGSGSGGQASEWGDIRMLTRDKHEPETSGEANVTARREAMARKAIGLAVGTF